MVTGFCEEIGHALAATQAGSNTEILVREAEGQHAPWPTRGQHSKVSSNGAFSKTLHNLSGPIWHTPICIYIYLFIFYLLRLT